MNPLDEFKSEKLTVQMDKFEIFKLQKPEGKELIKRYPELSDYLTGNEKAIQLNEYDALQGRVKSLVLD